MSSETFILFPPFRLDVLNEQLWRDTELVTVRPKPFAVLAYLATQLFRLARSIPDPALLLWAHTVQGLTLSTLGELPAALRRLEEGIALYDPQLHRPDRTQIAARTPR